MYESSEKKYNIDFGRHETEATEFGNAAWQGDVALIKRALEEGVDWDVEGNKPIYLAQYRGNWDIVELLLQAGSPLAKAHVNFALLIKYDLLPDLSEPDWHRTVLGRIKAALMYAKYDSKTLR